MPPLLLLVNDDGIDSPFLPVFAAALSARAEVCTVVPSKEQSWIGRAYNRHGKVEVGKKLDLDGVERYTVSGTPSDCVNIALSHILNRPPAAVVSGLNIGQNVAWPLLWSSGTFAAAAEGAAWGYPAFAFSLRLANKYYEAYRLRHSRVCGGLENIVKAASAHAAEFVLENLSKKSFADGEVLNVNYPEEYSREAPFKKCEPARVGLTRLYNKNAEGNFEFKYALGEIKKHKDITDLECLDSGAACWSSINIYGV